jgi:hypothetical protein
MSSSELERFLSAEGRSAVDRFMRQVAQEESDDFDVAEVLDRNLYDAVAGYDNRAGLSRWLSLRFTGPRAEGRLAEQAVEDLLGAFRREIIGASPAKSAESLRLDLVGFSRGSAILHLAPAEEAEVDPGDGPEEGQQTLTVDVDQIDHALDVVTSLHVAAEDAGDDALDKYDLDMGITWRGRTGRRRSAELTSRGRDYARRFFDRSDTSEVITVTGRIVELAISGSFDIKTGASLNSPRYKVHTDGEDSLLGLGLQLGQTISARLRRTTEQNKVGITFSIRYEFLGMVGKEDRLP